MIQLASQQVIQKMEAVLAESELVDRAGRVYTCSVTSTTMGFFRWKVFHKATEVGRVEVEILPGELYLHELKIDVRHRRAGLGTHLVERLGTAAGHLCCTTFSGRVSCDDYNSWPGIVDWFKRRLGFDVMLLRSGNVCAFLKKAI